MSRARDDARRVDDAIAGIRAPAGGPPTPRASDGRELCKLFMRRDRACDAPNCRRAHLDARDRPRCETYERYGLCDRGDGRECWLRHEPCEAWEMDACLLVDATTSRRHVERARRILGPRAVVKAGRVRLSRHTDALICV